MTQNNTINSPLPTTLAKGGTSADLSGSVSDGGIFYSTGSAGAILAGTATVRQGILSGASAAPSWSTVTYPSTVVVNRLLYSPSANVLGGLTTATSASLVTNSTGIPAWSGTMANGQVIIGSTSGTPAASTLTAGTNVTITNAAGSITINSSATGSGDFAWLATKTASSSASLNFDNNFSSSYVAYRIILVNVLPATNGAQLWLRLGTGSTPTYVATGYIYQLFDVSDNGTHLDYPGYTGSGFNQALLTYCHNNGINNSSTYSGVSGRIDLFVTSGSSNVAGGISHISHEDASISAYANTTCSFQQPAANFTSVQLLMSSGNIASGSAYLYGLT